MSALRQIVRTLRVVGSAKRNRLDLLRHLVRRPQLLASTGLYEVAVMLSARVDPKLKILAELKTAALVACEHCLDIGGALARGEGVPEAQLRDLHRYRTSDAFDATERLVLELAEAMSATPATVSDDLRARLEVAFAPTQVTELTAVIAWENQRARLNQALGVRPAGFSDGAFCPRPEVALAANG